jgi:hypothetical protein
MARPPAFEQAYPPALWEHERRFLVSRRGDAVPGDRPPADLVGVALSGGGIRSATFCLGVFQALAHHRVLSRIDYLSTVSGGGYFGSFLGRLFSRPEIKSPADVEHLLDTTRTGEAPPTAARRAELQRAIPDVIRWLRENGRYLSPNGSGDLLLGAAIMLRNWAAIHVVLLSLVLLALLAAQVVRVGLEVAARPPDGALALGLARLAPSGASPIWWSPYCLVPAVLLVAWATPLAWAYWLTGQWATRRWYERPVAGVAAVAVVALGSLGWGLCLLGRDGAGPWLVGGVIGAAVVALTVVAWGAAQWRAGTRADAKSAEGVDLTPEERRGFELEEQRNRLSIWLRNALLGTGGGLLFSAVDSLGQTAYLAAHQPGSNLLAYLGTVLSALAGVAAFARRLATAAGGTANGARLRLPASIVAAALALVIVGVLLISVSMLAHGVAWGFRPPASASRPSVPLLRGVPDWWTLALVWFVVGVFCLLFGRIWLFVNNSSLHSMYSARLTRAYLGASNPLRRHPGDETVTRVLPGDNADPATYWALAPAGGPDPTQRPLHLINVTINETMDGRSQIQQQDRKGLGLAIGPCALSVGVRHHAVFPTHRELRHHPQRVEVFPALSAATPAGGPAPYRVFDVEIGRWRGGEALSIGAWVGISGAAFSTGMGSRTSLGLSLLCGFANVRLGYWWDSAVRRALPKTGARVLRAAERAFPVQVYLLNEFLSRFYGTSRARWFLSDGGHFENMGGYELIRRRLARILLVDAEADPHYTFEGLANLIRKARLDFGADIAFLTPDELDAAVAPPHRHLFGSLEQLRRGRWSDEPVADPRTGQARRSVDDPIDETRQSLAHAALARVTFEDEPARVGWLVYLKPTLTGDESPDLTQYHRAHPSFPQETTGDQFFDEAQWESYRQLGFLIARAVFGEGRPTSESALPEALTPREILFG